MSDFVLCTKPGVDFPRGRSAVKGHTVSQVAILSPTLLCACYAMSGTNVAYLPTRLLCNVRVSAYALLCDVRYRPRRRRCVAAYQLQYRTPLPTPRGTSSIPYVLCARNAMSRTDV
eukprot:605730-Rhodomonas_salina.1